MSQKSVTLNHIEIANDRPFALIAGPCAMENRDHAMMTADRLRAMTDDLGIGLIYKSSFDKANRTSIDSGRGIGLQESLSVFEEVKREIGCPVLTDVHAEDQCATVAEVVDVLQIPAFLCRQTDLLVAAAKTGKVVNIKKGQFLAPWDMKNVARKVAENDNEQIMLTERGVSFGYNTLVSDMRALPVLAETGYPVVFDATHSVAQPGGRGTASGGQREYVPVLASAAVAVGVAAVFTETHEEPDRAPSDGPNMMRLDEMPALLTRLRALDRVVKESN